MHLFLLLAAFMLGKYDVFLMDARVVLRWQLRLNGCHHCVVHVQYSLATLEDVASCSSPVAGKTTPSVIITFSPRHPSTNRWLRFVMGSILSAG